MIPEKRKNNLSKGFCLLLIVSLINQMIFPTVMFALTGGPSQPEVQSFEPVSTTQMVDPFTGDFVYNIPLMDVDGYPVNISYHGGLTMDQEASWVGLGWNLNVGNINRGMRGLPDDFSGEKDTVIKHQNIKKSWTIGIDVNRSIEFTGIPCFRPGVGTGFGIFYNNYRGIGLNLSLMSSYKVNFYGLNAGLTSTATVNSQEGLSYDQSMHLGFSLGKQDVSNSSMDFSFSSHYNTRAGTKSRTIGLSTGGAQKGIGTSSTIPVGDQTYVPNISMPMKNFSLNLSSTIGGEIAWIAGMKKVAFSYNMQKLARSTQASPAYGYMYSDKAEGEKKALLDINREKDGMYTPHRPMLPVTNFTYDIYSVTGQGVGGIYRPYRNDKGTVSDPLVEEKSSGFVLGGDFAIGGYFKGGLNIGGSSNYNYSGKWEDDGDHSAQSILKFKGKDPVNPEYEPYYFKAAGELTPINESNLDEMGGEYAVNVNLSKGGNTKDIYESFKPIKNSQYTKRQNRNQAIAVLNAQEAKSAALEQIKSYSISPSGFHTYLPISRTSNGRKSQHISEITTYRTDGARYVYGIPAYNTYQKEVTFNTGSNPPQDEKNGTMTYSGKMNSVKNGEGFDNYFNSTELPGYAHSYLLTAVLSADYVDRTGDGPTDDDLGTYTKFNYQRHSTDYGWRTPYLQNTANYDQGYKSDAYDDKGNYIYGKKEVWYLKSVVTKKMVAEFSLSPRDDSRGVIDENGGLSTSPNNTLLKLDKISLYAKCERESKGQSAVPMQEVHFVYDDTYSLCPNVLNNFSSNGASHKGKLTLKEIYFTYLQSKKGKLSPYRFTYDGFNPEYAAKSCDRWGNYKPNDPNFPNDDFPYTDQNKTNADLYASAWSLTKIDLPSGGKIEVNYEADDYAFVQDKRAMQMVRVIGFGNDSTHINSEYLYTGKLPNNYVRLQLPIPVTGKQDFIDKYLRPAPNEQRIDKIYFKCSVDLIGKIGGIIETADRQEFVTGYAEITDECETYGPKVAGKYPEVWIKLKDVSIAEFDSEGDKKYNPKANPIARTAWQLTRINFSKELYPGSGKDAPGDESAKDLIIQLAHSILGMFKDITQNRRGLFYAMLTNGFGKKVDINGKSRIRLFSPEYKKIGGGSRVKSIQVNDNWNSMADHSNAAATSYGQQYDYTKILEGSKTEDNANGVVISSGVAEYEPLIGNEENPLRQPLAYSVEHWSIPNDGFYVETPVGESFYPGASVGYSEIKIKSMQSGTGYIKHEYYTARDFPVINEHTEILRKEAKPKLIDRLLKFTTKTAMAVSQGHVIKLNNMHGQKKAMWVYEEGGEHPISGQEFFYRTQQQNDHELDNTITAINKKGEVITMVAGKESDFVADFRRNKSEGWNLHVEVDVDVSPTPFFGFPIPIISVIPRYSYASTDFKSAVVTKVITSYGILEKTVAYDMGSRVSAENLAYDSETGEVLLTKSENDFNDAVYTFNYPAHWAYDQMGMAYKNLGVQINGVKLQNGKAIINKESYKKLFVRGDEVMVSDLDMNLWVNSISYDDDDKLEINLIDKDGNKPTDKNNVSLTIIRSGRRNMQSIPVGTITMLRNPISQKKLNFNDILSASATEYSDNWPDYCECGIDNGKMGDDGTDPPDFAAGLGYSKFIPNGNYYTQGSAGNWKIKRNYVFLAKRTSSSENRNLNIRKDGTYETFDPFWKSNKGYDWKGNNPNWSWTTEVSKMSAYGFELENRDSLNNFSSAIYGYSNTLAIAVAKNSRYKEIGVDNFEDYNCTNCGSVGKEDHWSFKNNADKVVSTTAHTGKKSIQVKKHSKASVGKKLKCVEKKPDIPS